MSVRRLCHHQSDYIGSGNNYWASPRASISRDGRFVIFSSNWGNLDRTDVFIMKIPVAPGEETPKSITNINTNSFSLFPNPSSNLLQIDAVNNVNFTIAGTVNYLGADVDVRFINNKAAVEFLPTGLYFTKVLIGNNYVLLPWEKK